MLLYTYDFCKYNTHQKISLFFPTHSVCIIALFYICLISKADSNTFKLYKAQIAIAKWYKLPRSTSLAFHNSPIPTAC